MVQTYTRLLNTYIILFNFRPSKARSEQRINGYNVETGHVNHNQVISPTSDDVDIFDSHCFATTPSSSNASDAEEPVSYTHLTLPTNREV